MEIIKQSKVMRILVITFCALFAFCSVGASESLAKNYTQKSNALLKYNHKKVPHLNNTDGLSKEKPKKYSSSPNFFGRYAYETRANTFTPTKSIRMDGIMKTDLFISMYSKKERNLANPQSVVLTPDNKYLYVVHGLSGAKRNKGIIVRYDYEGILALGLNNPGNMDKIRIATYNSAKGLDTEEDKEIMKLIKIGPTISIGHGQSLSYNYKTKELWMWNDPTKKNGSWKDAYKGVLQRINPDTLRPDKSITFRMKTPTGNRVVMGHVLAFDKKGYGYFTVQVGNSDPKAKRTNIYRLEIKKNKVKVKIMQSIKIAPNPKRLQGMTYNPAKNRLVLYAEDAITTIPVNKLGKLKKRDLQYAIYNTRREFEGMCYSSDGYGYLLVNRGPELLKMTTNK